MVALLMCRSISSVLGSSIGKIGPSSAFGRLCWHHFHTTFPVLHHSIKQNEQFSLPATSQAMLASRRKSAQLSAVKDYIQQAKVLEGGQSFPTQLKIKQNTNFSKETWYMVLGFGQNCQENDFRQLISALSSLTDEEFVKADQIQFSKQETVVDALNNLLRKRLSKDQRPTNEYKAWKPTQSFLFHLGSLMCKLCKEQTPLFLSLFDKLCPHSRSLRSMSTPKLIAICTFAAVDRGMPRFCSDAIQEELSSRQKRLSPKQTAYMVFTLSQEAKVRLSLESMTIVVGKCQELLDGPEALTPDEDVSPFSMLMATLHFYCCLNFDSIDKWDRIRQLILELVSSVLAAEGKGSNLPFNCMLLLLSCCAKSRIGSGNLTPFLSCLDRKLLSLKVSSISFPGQLNLANTLLNYPQLSCQQSVLEQIETDCAQRLHKGSIASDVLHSSVAPDESLLLPSLLRALVLHGRFPKPLLEAVLSPHFYTNMAKKCGTTSGSHQHLILCVQLYFLDSTAQIMLPDSRLPRISQSVIQDLMQLREMFTKKTFDANTRMLEMVERYLRQILGGRQFQRGRLLPHFDLDDIVIQCSKDGQPVSFRLNSSIRPLKLQKLRLHSQRKGLVLTMGTRISRSFELLELSKVEQYKKLGYQVEQIDGRDWWWKDEGKSWNRLEFSVALEKILNKHGIKSVIKTSQDINVANLFE